MPSRLPRSVRADLRRLVESEELGESFFSAAADRAHRNRDAEAWQALHRLEVQTNRGIKRFVEHHGIELATTNRRAETAGAFAGSALVYLPWPVQLQSVRVATHRYLPAFQRLSAAFTNSQYQPFFEYVVQHELAIIDFTRRALDSSRAALNAVQDLLDHPVPIPGY